MIRRAILGLIETSFGILAENCAADFPVRLASVQVRSLTVTDHGVSSFSLLLMIDIV